MNDGIIYPNCTTPESKDNSHNIPKKKSVENGQYVPLGRAGVKVSRLALGTVNFGGRVDDKEAQRVMDHAVASGINFVDTANMYGWRVHKGYTEELIGRWLMQTQGRRDNVVVATKVGNEMTDGPNGSGLSARHIVSACEASLRRLKTDWIDIYQMHRVDYATGWDEVWQAMEQLTVQGKVRYIGSSNFAGWNLVAAQEAALRRNFLGIASEQCVYNLATRYAELEILPAAQEYGLATYAWSPLHGGLLGGVLRKIAAGSAVKSAQGRAETALRQHRALIERYEALCDEHSLKPAAVGLSWVLSRPGITGAVIGPRTESHVDDAVRAVDTKLPSDLVDQLEEMFPAPGGGRPAPDAWID